MDSFYLIVLGVASLVLIIMLAFLGWRMSQAKKGENYPTIIKTCPDNWTVDSTTVAGKMLCKRPAVGQANYGLVATSDATVDNNLSTYMTTDSSPGYYPGLGGNYLNSSDEKWSACVKKNWATKYKIKWDSIDSANYCD